MKKILYIGDSTVQFYKIDSYPQTGMSQALMLFTAKDVEVHHHARGGRSTKSFLSEGRFDCVKQKMQEGDFLFIQFGHNDEKPDEYRHTEPYGSFQENLRYYIQTAREAGAYPVLITPIARCLFDENGQLVGGTHGQYPEAIRKLGQIECVPVVDMDTISEAYLKSLSMADAKKMYVDGAHLLPDGAIKMAGFLCCELEKLGKPYSEILYKPEVDTQKPDLAP